MCEGSVANVRTESFGGSFANDSGFGGEVPDEDETMESVEKRKE
jgi:hypothetical protein